MDKNIEVIFNKLPKHIRENIYKFNENQINRFEEIRIRTDRDSTILCDGKEINLNDRKLITPEVLEETLNRLLDYSYYAYEEELSKGYITIRGGHRVGICGKVILKNGIVHIIKEVSSLNIRRSREILGAADKIIPVIVDNKKKQLLNTLIISPPKCGKTTLLRDIARSLSISGYKVGICDERSEIAGCYDGRPSYDLGPRTDILDGCPKAQGIKMLIRSMSPDVIITDEIGKIEDSVAIEDALCAGVKIITSIHGSSYEEVLRSSVGSLISDNVFENLVFLTSIPVTGTISRILKSSRTREGVENV